MNCLKRLNDVFPTGLEGSGIFSYMNTIEPLPWSEDEYISNVVLDIEYFGNISGGKIVSPLMDRIISDETISNSEMTKISNIIISMYYAKWAKLYDTLIFEYNPINNYDMLEIMTNDATVTQYGKTTTRTDNLTHSKTGTETETPNTTETRTDNLTHAKTGTETETPNITETRTDNLTHAKTGTETETPNTTETRTDNLTHSKTGTETETPNTTETRTDNLTHAKTGTETDTPNLTKNVDNEIFGFNSSTAVGSDNQSSVTTGTDQKTYNTQETETGTQTTAKTGTDQITYNTQETETGTQANVDSGSDTRTRNYRLSRSGNIGVTTTQQMIEQERNIAMWDFFYKVVFPDVDRVMTIAIY